MNINSRLKAIQHHINSNRELFAEKPDFDNWTEERIDEYIKTETEKFHKQNAIKCFADSERVYKLYLERELITEDEYKIFIEGEKKYFWKCS